MPAETKVQLRLGERVVAEVPFEGAELRIGRMKENDLVINNLAVSRFHAVLRRAGEGFEIEDLGSENGTFVEGIAVRGAALAPVGAAITIGKHTLSLRQRGGVAAALPQAAVRAPLPQAARNDVWDAAQTYLVAARPAREEEVAVAIEAGRDEEGVAEAVEAPPESMLPVELLTEACVELSEAGAEESAFGEDELVGAAAPDAAAAEAAVASLEPAELEPLLELAPSAAAATPGPARPDPAGQTALFDFGLTDDLGLSDRALARAANERSAAEPPPPPPAQPAAPPQHAGLIVERLGKVERVVPWEDGELVAGRAPECALVLGASGVSRRHARFVREGTGFRVIDLGSANGIRVNGERVESHLLAVGDVVAIDDYAITFVLDREPVDGVVSAVPAPPARPEPRLEPRVSPPVPTLAIPERDLVTDADDETALLDAEKQLELSTAPTAAPRATSRADAAWHFEITIATERLPEALRRALRELGEDELRLPAELRLVRRD